MPLWCNGSHACLRSKCRKTYQFESGQRHKNTWVVELVDTQDLDTVLLKNKNLSALQEIEDVEPRKFGEPF